VTEMEHQLVSMESDRRRVRMPNQKEVGWLFLGGGLVASALSLLRGRRGFTDLAVPLGLVGVGCGVLLQQRQTHMEAAEENITAALDALDPLARAQVLKAVAQDQLARLPGGGD